MTNVESTRAPQEQDGPGRRLLRALGLSAATGRSGTASPVVFCPPSTSGPVPWELRAMIELDDLTLDSSTTPLPDHGPEDESDDSYTSDLHSPRDTIGWSSATPHWVTETPSTPYGPRSALHRRTISFASVASTSSTSSSPQTFHDLDGRFTASPIHRHIPALARQPSRHHVRKSQEASRVWRDYW